MRTERTRSSRGSVITQGVNGAIVFRRPKVERRRDHRYYPWNAFDRLAIDALELDGSAGFDSSRSVVKQEEL